MSKEENLDPKIEKTPKIQEKRVLDPTNLDDANRIKELVEKAITVFATLPGNPRPESKGGALSVSKGDIPVMVIPVMDYDLLKVVKYFNFCLEKPRRALSYGHTNSFASRDGVTKWGGAICWNGWAVAFSGLPELGDECVSAYVMVESGWATWKDIETIIGIHNHFLASFMEAIYK